MANVTASSTIVRCPYCNAEQDPAAIYEIDDGMYWTTFDCEGCDKEFRIDVEKVVRISASPLSDEDRAALAKLEVSDEEASNG